MKTAAVASALGLAAGAYAKVPCSLVVPGAAPIKDPRSVSSFVYDPVYSELARNATLPSRYLPVFVDLPAAFINTETYLGYRRLEAYNTDDCAAHCALTPGCKAINIFVLRAPTLVIGVGCPNPPAMATYRCSMYSAPLVVSTDVNYGQLRAPTGSNLTDVFQARIRGSNGYNLESDCPAVNPVTVTVAPTPASASTPVSAPTAI